jgi:hypothetical protein
VPIAVKVTSVQGCQDSLEVPGEVVCLVGMSAGMRDGFAVPRCAARMARGSASSASTRGRTVAGRGASHDTRVGREEVARDPEAAKDVQMQEAQTTMQVKAINECEVKRQTATSCATRN